MLLSDLEPVHTILYETPQTLIPMDDDEEEPTEDDKHLSEFVEAVKTRDSKRKRMGANEIIQIGEHRFCNQQATVEDFALITYMKKHKPTVFQTLYEKASEEGFFKTFPYTDIGQLMNMMYERDENGRTQMGREGLEMCFGTMEPFNLENPAMSDIKSLILHWYKRNDQDSPHIHTNVLYMKGEYFRNPLGRMVRYKRGQKPACLETPRMVQWICPEEPQHYIRPEVAFLLATVCKSWAACIRELHKTNTFGRRLIDEECFRKKYTTSRIVYKGEVRSEAWRISQPYFYHVWAREKMHMYEDYFIRVPVINVFNDNITIISGRTCQQQPNGNYMVMYKVNEEPNRVKIFRVKMGYIEKLHSRYEIEVTSMNCWDLALRIDSNII